MIKSKSDLKKCLEEDYKYYEISLKEKIRDNFVKEHLRVIWKYIKYLRYEEYYSNKKSLIYKPWKLLFTRKKNKLGNKLGFYIHPNCFEEGLTICHHGNIIVNGYSKIGKNCVLHGDNCIGNDGKSKKAPQIGNNVNIGIGAKIIGDIYLADNIKIGANAVVIKSCYTEGATLVGIPAKEVKK